MKRIILLIVILISSLGFSFADNMSVNKIIDEIRRQYIEINLKESQCIKISIPTIGEFANVSNRVGFYDNAKIIKMISSGMIGMGESEYCEYYFDDNNLFFVYSKNFNLSDGTVDPNYPDRVMVPPKENRYYFYQGELIRWVSGDNIISSDSKEFLDKNQMFKKLNSDLSKIKKAPYIEDEQEYNIKEDELIIKIRKLYNEINFNEKQYSKKNEEDWGRFPQSEEIGLEYYYYKNNIRSISGAPDKISGYYDNAKLKKVVGTYYGQIGKSVIEYYFDDDNFFFVYAKTYYYGEPISYYYEAPIYDDDYKIAKTKDDRYYFHKGNLIKWISNGKVVTKETQEFLYKRYLFRKYFLELNKIFVNEQ